MQLMFESQLLILPSKLNQSIEWNQTPELKDLQESSFPQWSI